MRRWANRQVYGSRPQRQQPERPVPRWLWLLTIGTPAAVAVAWLLQ